MGKGYQKGVRSGRDQVRVGSGPRGMEVDVNRSTSLEVDQINIPGYFHGRTQLVLVIILWKLA